MNQETYLPNTSERTLKRGSEINEKIDTNIILKEIGDITRKLEKTRNVLHNAGAIEVGITPNEIIHEARLYRLLHYRPMVSKTAKTPILFVYALINRSYILDLQPDKSWIRNLLGQGFDIYLIDWKTPARVDKYVSFDDYVNEYIDDCVDYVRTKTSVNKITLHGYCMGATMSAIYSTLHEDKIRNLATIAPVIDSNQDTTVLGNFSRHLEPDRMFNSIGNLPSERALCIIFDFKAIQARSKQVFQLS